MDWGQSWKRMHTARLMHGSVGQTALNALLIRNIPVTTESRQIAFSFGDTMETKF